MGSVLVNMPNGNMPNGRVQLPDMPGVLLEKRPSPVVSLATACLCGEVTPNAVPFDEVAAGTAGYLFECDGCGAQWAVGVRVEVTNVMVGKPTRMPAVAPTTES